MRRITRTAPMSATGAAATRLAVALERPVKRPGVELICEAIAYVARAGFPDARAAKECL